MPHASFKINDVVTVLPWVGTSDERAVIQHIDEDTAYINTLKFGGALHQHAVPLTILSRNLRVLSGEDLPPIRSVAGSDPQYKDLPTVWELVIDAFAPNLKNKMVSAEHLPTILEDAAKSEPAKVRELLNQTCTTQESNSHDIYGTLAQLIIEDEVNPLFGVGSGPSLLSPKVWELFTPEEKFHYALRVSVADPAVVESRGGFTTNLDPWKRRAEKPLPPLEVPTPEDDTIISTARAYISTIQQHCFRHAQTTPNEEIWSLLPKGAKASIIKYAFSASRMMREEETICAVVWPLLDPRIQTDWLLTEKNLATFLETNNLPPQVSLACELVTKARLSPQQYKAVLAQLENFGQTAYLRLGTLKSHLLPDKEIAAQRQYIEFIDRIIKETSTALARNFIQQRIPAPSR